MTSKSIENLLPLTLDIKQPTATVSNDKDFVFDRVLFDTEALSVLQAVFSRSSQDNTVAESSKSASVKFMITKQDETDLRRLGYNKAQIDMLKPQEALDIIQAGTKL